MSTLRGLIGFILISLNTILIGLPIQILALFKLCVPLKSVHRTLGAIAEKFGQLWISINSVIFSLTQSIEWEVSGLPHLSCRQTYLITSNHQSWVDILILQKMFNHQIPFIRFFIKRELAWIPLLGPAWWVLNYPMMRRQPPSPKNELAASRNRDLEATAKACETLQGMPVSILNFIEGTRFSPNKWRNQHSPYKHLLIPKIGGLYTCIQSFGEQIQSLLDVTIVYPGKPKNFWEFLCGKVDRVIVHVREIHIPKEFLRKNANPDDGTREKFKLWIQQLWAQKDHEIDQILGGGPIKGPQDENI